MADEMNDDLVLDDEGEESGGKSKTGLLIILVIGVLVVLIGAVAAFFLLKGSKEPSGNEVATLQEEELPPIEDIPAPTGKPILFPVGDIYVNIAGTRSTRVLKFTPVLEVNEPQMELALEDYRTLLKDRISTVARKMSFDELEGANGPEILKQEIRDSLNRSLRKRLNGAIIAVHFDDFLIQ